MAGFFQSAEGRRSEGRRIRAFATEIWQGNGLTIAALQDIIAEDLHAVEKAIRDKYKVDINLNTSPDEIHQAVAEARATKVS